MLTTSRDIPRVDRRQHWVVSSFIAGRIPLRKIVGSRSNIAAIYFYFFRMVHLTPVSLSCSWGRFCVPWRGLSHDIKRKWKLVLSHDVLLALVVGEDDVQPKTQSALVKAMWA
jgi:hypothetical protein